MVKLERKGAQTNPFLIMKKILFFLALIFFFANNTVFGFKVEDPGPTEAVKLLDPDKIAYDAIARIGGVSTWEIAATATSAGQMAQHVWPTWDVTETVAVEFSSSSTVNVAVGADSLQTAVPVARPHNALVVQLTAQSAVPWNKITVSGIRINGEDYSEFTPLMAEASVVTHDYLVITDLPKSGQNIASYVVELDMYFSSELGLPSTYGELQLNVFAVQTATLNDPALIDYVQVTPDEARAIDATYEVVSGQGFLFRWKGEANRWYALEWSTDLHSWVSYETYLQGDGNALLEFLAERQPGQTRMFVRLVHGPPPN